MKMIWALADAALERGRERQPLFRAVPPDQLFEARLVDRDLAALQQPDLGRILVDADDLVPVLGQAGAGDQSDVSGPDDRNFHPISLPQGCKPLKLAQPKKWCQSIERQGFALLSGVLRSRPRAHPDRLPAGAAPADRRRRVRPRLAGALPGAALAPADALTLFSSSWKDRLPAGRRCRARARSTRGSRSGSSTWPGIGSNGRRSSGSRAARRRPVDASAADSGRAPRAVRDDPRPRIS